MTRYFRPVPALGARPRFVALRSVRHTRDVVWVSNRWPRAGGDRWRSTTPASTVRTYRHFYGGVAECEGVGGTTRDSDSGRPQWPGVPSGEGGSGTRRRGMVPVLVRTRLLSMASTTSTGVP